MRLFPKKRGVNRKIERRDPLYRVRRTPWDWLNLGILVIFILFLGLTGTLLLSSLSPFDLRNVSVRGELIHTTSQEITELGEIPLRTNLLTLNLFKVSKNIERHPWVRHVTVRRQFPHSLVIHVEEHRPAAILQVSEKPYLITQEGVIFKKWGPEDGSQLPVISGFEKDKLQKHPRYFKPLLLESLEFLARLQEIHSGGAVFVKSVRCLPVEGISAEICHAGAGHEECGTIFFGSGGFTKKMSAWLTLFETMEENKEWFRSIDLHVEGRVFARLTPQKGEKNGP